MLVHLCVAILAIFGVHRGLCLRCYSCVSTENEACIRFDKNKVPLKTCGIDELRNTEADAAQVHKSFKKLYEVDLAQEPQLPLNCLKQVTRFGGKHMVLRGCQLAPSDQLDICLKVKQENSDMLLTSHCSLCSGEGCNAAPVKRPLLSFLATICVVVATLLIYS
ncbi:unnamed protein product [Tenebrio molitor]|jgi:hypothetical protein|nr:unnamed protein product [Tenebrio molitor]